MEQSVKKNKVMRTLYNDKGVSLVEVMIALVVLLLVFIGLLQAALLGIDHNMRNLLREEAVNVAAARLEEVRNEPFANVVSDTTSLPGGVDCPNTFTNGERIQRTFRNITKDFCTNITCKDVDGDDNCATDDAASNTKRINVRVTWRWKGEDFIQSATTLRRR
ncbi:MAG: prepilin-type N-terminal cleavage/methylation domain-containing protein [Nitrospirae bacterium]|nr:prepilin-type N-terminal cleavage/methylation domain-containing protein [Nitrospirota bacterium]